MGVLKDGKTAVFLVDDGVTPVGDGDCRPSPEACETIRMKAGETEFLDVKDATGTVTDQYQLDLIKIHSGKTASATKAKASSRAGAASCGPARRAAVRPPTAGTPRAAPCGTGAARCAVGLADRRRPPLALRRAPGSLNRLPGVSLRVITAGESHGPGLTTIVEGLPAGLELDREAVNDDMARRQLGHGRGGRMKIERDSAEITAGVRHGRTLGGPVALQVANRDYANWEERMNPWPVEAAVPEVHLPRPGHADLAGVWKFGFSDVRNVLERASARETAARVAGGALAKAFLRAVGVEIVSHVTQIGSVRAPERDTLALADFAEVDASPVRCLDPEVAAAMVEEINVLRKRNESLGGTFELRAFGLVPGLGSHVSWEERLDGRIGMALLSIQACKGVGLGDGFDLAGRPGSEAHDEIFYDEQRGYFRETTQWRGFGWWEHRAWGAVAQMEDHPMAKSYSVDEPRSADAVERTRRQRRPKATQKSIKAKAPKRQTRSKSAVRSRGRVKPAAKRPNNKSASTCSTALKVRLWKSCKRRPAGSNTVCAASWLGP